MIETIGACVYCGQAHMVRVPEGFEEGEINREATMLCDCDEARGLQFIETNINVTEAYIQKEFGDAPAVQEVIMAAVKQIGRSELEKITVVQGRTTYKMARTAKGTIKIQKETKIVEAAES